MVLSHYHHTYIYFNLTSIKFSLAELTSNLYIFNHFTNKYNNTIKSLFLQAHAELNNTYDSYVKLNSFNSLLRKKRGLINFLGSSIKFITGNLDDDDLENINQHMQILKNNQINSMHKINELSSFAGHITARFQENVNIINENSKKLKANIDVLNDTIMLLVEMQNQLLQIKNVHSYLEKLLRTLTFAHLESLDLEILNTQEIKEIWNYLEIQYPKNLLWPIKHIIELTLICKTGLILSDDMAILVIKIPIFEIKACNLQMIYPIPTSNNTILISPSKYYCNNLWYTKCSEINTKWICTNPIINGCNLLTDCTFAKISNNYQVHTLTYHKALLFCTKTSETVFENCFQFVKHNLTGCSYIQSQCDVIISQYKYALQSNGIRIKNTEIQNTVLDSNLSLNLQLKHLMYPEKIQEDLREPIVFKDFVAAKTHVTSTIVLFFISVLILMLVMYLWQKKHKSIPLKTLQDIINEDVEES